MAKVHWQATPDFKTACGLQASATIPYSTNAADVDCKTCQKLIPEATLTIWDRLRDEDEVVPAPVPKTRAKRSPRKPRPDTVIMIGRRSGMSLLSAQLVADHVAGVEETRAVDVRAQYIRTREEARAQQAQVQYRIRFQKEAWIFVVAFIVLGIFKWLS